MGRQTRSVDAMTTSRPETSLAKQVQALEARLKRLEESQHVSGQKGAHAAHRLKLPKPKALKRRGRKAEVPRGGVRFEDVVVDFTNVIFQPLSIFGSINNLNFIIPNQQDARNMAIQDFEIAMPDQAVLVLPILQGWNLLYGDLQNQGAVADVGDDHNVANAFVNVFVADQQAGSVTIRVQMVLTDNGFDKQWAGQVWVTVLFLGPTPPDNDLIWPIRPWPWPFPGARKPSRKAR
jgi:hypothetical protein